MILLPLLLLGCEEVPQDTIQKEIIEEDTLVDVDNDGFLSDEDCDDGNPEVYPNASEICDGIDNNCDGQIDEGTLMTIYEDIDGDGFGNPDASLESCEVLNGFATTGTDCDDRNASIYPSNIEICDDLDNNCNDLVDDEDPNLDVQTADVYYVDLDNDGFGNPDESSLFCLSRDGFVENADDCNDDIAEVSPIGEEICDDIDNDCDGDIDENQKTIYYEDFDDDGFGNPLATTLDCSVPVGYVENSDDCDDANSEAYPSADEYCDDIDSDCDGDLVDEAVVDAAVFYQDLDGDGFGDIDSIVVSCEAPEGYVSDAQDCDDNNNTINPNFDEICDGIDNNCDQRVDDSEAVDAPIWYLDSDNDGYGSTYSVYSCVQPDSFSNNNLDCDDSNLNISPEGLEICDGIDNDCDTNTDEEDDSLDENTMNIFYVDIDNDGFGLSSSAYQACFSDDVLMDGDCDDNAILIHPNAVEVCDSIDNNCDQLIDDEDDNLMLSTQTTFYLDSDQDGFGNPNITEQACTIPEQYVTNNLDCDDEDASENPNITWFQDLDGDGFGNPSVFALCEKYSLTDVLISGDCDDNDAMENPDVTWYADVDGDGFGDSEQNSQCERESTTDVLDNTDCDDTDATEHPEVLWYTDNDLDGFGNPDLEFLCERNSESDVLNADDCDDDDILENPDATWYTDVDGDGFGVVFASECQRTQPSDSLYNTDCNDNNDSIYPQADTVCNDVDNDCDEFIDFDDDLDGYSDASCGGRDCDDSNINALPEIDGGCAMGTSCEDILNNGYAIGDDIYVIDPDGWNTGIDGTEVYCDMSTDGGGWMLVSRSYPDASSSAGSWGWYANTRGGLENFGEPYNIGYYTTFYGTGLEFDEILVGNQENISNYNWGPFVYKYENVDHNALMTENTQQFYSRTTIYADTSVLDSESPPGMQNQLGFASSGTNGSTSLFYMRDCCGYSTYGGSAYGMITTYINHNTLWAYAGPWGNTTNSTDGNGNFIQTGDSSSSPHWGGTWQYMIFVR